ncbi:MAG: response regulator [Cyanobacteriota bacterium]|nr:response regulator [Cyanobacteriota bacterium]
MQYTGLILIVDDQPTNLAVISETLTAVGYDVAIATSGERALKQLERRLPDLILLDIQMPIMDGFEVCQKLKANPHTCNVPVIFMTALSDVDHKIQGFELGAVDYITKPFHEQEVLARIKTHVQLKKMEVHLKAEVERRQQTVRELENLTKRLEISNQELQDFAYVSSHDLQEPLRKIQAFGDRLKSTCQDSLNDKGLDYLERMLNAASRAQILINDLLAFSRVTTKAKPFEAINLSQVLAGVLSDLEIRIEQTKAKLEVDSLPVIEADALQMRQLLQNLISNALKFQAEGHRPMIQIRSRQYLQNGQEWCEIQIVDNGIGFEEKYTDRIFQIFQRLHGRSTYQGTGIGLAICRKIAERHGGTLTAKSQPNQGATFIFTLPVHQTSGGLHG